MISVLVSWTALHPSLAFVSGLALVIWSRVLFLSFFFLLYLFFFLLLCTCILGCEILQETEADTVSVPSKICLMEVCFSPLDFRFWQEKSNGPSLPLDTRPHLGICERSILPNTHQRMQGFGVRFDGVKLLGWIRWGFNLWKPFRDHLTKCLCVYGTTRSPHREGVNQNCDLPTFSLVCWDSPLLNYADADN